MRDVAIIGCRLFAIYWFVTGIQTLAYSALAYESLLRAQSLHNSELDPLLVITTNIMPLAIHMIVASLLWFKAEKISELILPKKQAKTASNNKNYHAIQTLIFSGIGAFILLAALPKLGATIYEYHLMNRELAIQSKVSMAKQVAYLQYGIEIALGFALLIGAHALSKFLLWLREFGLKSKD